MSPRAGRRVAIVGGGITGLAAAYELARAPDPPEVTLFEADHRLGGKLRTTPFAGVAAVDEGADAFLARVPWAVDLAHELGVDDLVAPSANGAFVWWDGALHPIPAGLVLGVPAGLGGLARSRLLSLRGKLRAGVEPFVPRGHPAADNLGALISHRFGSEVLERLVDPLIGAVNAGDTRDLSLEATAPNVAAAARTSRSLLLGLRAGRPAASRAPVFLAPAAGMESLVQRLVDRLDGVRVRLGEAVTELERTGTGWTVNGQDADRVLLAVPADVAGRALGAISPDAAATLGAVGYASVAIVTLAFPTEAVRRRLDGSGHLVPKPAQRHLTAVSWASTKWPHWSRPGQVVLRASVGRWGDEHAVALDDDALVAAVLADLAVQLGVRDGPTAVRISRWPRSFPQYRPGHLPRVAALEAALAADAPGVAVAGAAHRGLGVPACIRQGRDWAGATMRDLAR